MTIADYIFAACMTVVIVWIVSEGDRRGPFQKFGRDKYIKNSRGSISEFKNSGAETKSEEEEAGRDADTIRRSSGFRYGVQEIP